MMATEKWNNILLILTPQMEYPMLISSKKRLDLQSSMQSKRGWCFTAERQFAAVHESGCGPSRKCPRSAPTSAYEGKAEKICSLRVVLFVTDAVEKVGATLPTRNNGIAQAGFLNRSCAFAARLESILLEDPLKIFFRQYRPEGDIHIPIDVRFAQQAVDLTT